MTSNSSLKKIAFSGTVLTFFSYGSQQAIRFAGNLILTRLLEPELFGLMALVTSLRVGIELFSDFGTNQNIIQSEKGKDPKFYNTAWTIQVIRGFVLWGLSLLITFPLASFYQEDRLLIIFPIIGFTTVLDGFTSTSETLLRRDLKLGLVTANRIGLRLVSLIITISWALVSPTIWALVAGTLSFAGIGIFSSHYLLPGPPNRFCLDQKTIADIVNFGRWMFVATILFFLASQADRLILAKVFSFELVGVYTIAYALANLPREVIKRISSQVVFPLLSKRKGLPRQELRHKISGARAKCLLIVALGLAPLTAFGDSLIGFLYDARYEDAEWMFSILCLGVWFSSLANIGTNTLLAFGKPKHNAYSYALRLIVISLGIYFGSMLFGVRGAIVAVALSDVFAYLGIQYGLFLEKITFLKQDLLMTVVYFSSVTCLLFFKQSMGW